MSGGNGHGRYADMRCPVLSCPCNRGERGCYCDFLIHGWPCDHPRFREQWRERTDGGCLVGLGNQSDSDGRRSLVARVTAARAEGGGTTREEARERLRQLGLLEEVTG